MANVTSLRGPGGDSTTFLLATISPGHSGPARSQLFREALPAGARSESRAAEAILTLIPHSNTNAAVGADSYNYQGYHLLRSDPVTLNTYIAKLDYNLTTGTIVCLSAAL